MTVGMGYSFLPGCLRIGDRCEFFNKTKSMISQIFFQDHLKTTLVRKVDHHSKEISITHCSYTYILSVYIRDKSPNLIVHHHHHINDCSDYY